ncbi:hypothetical protein [Glycomyces algeriensis]|uniref:Uncharacterized protein n=1 Tax=Glycomyces algeriensis TaxID=256037 RepID=A0A9W6GB29_9ACTN|nr:hypothetical protein [Glycomyces algeriensis]MDA1364757.1 hypothetical protein [Glycomyces algeriensis]MDR7350798.1 hypothetical protein [Glycomyces algeriensis]GLI43509.1 hypothetical protein GALLR39Z86_33590 [Glycomyces algeriensis]
MFLEEFKNSLLYAKLPTHWAVEAAVAATTFAVIAAALLLLDAGDRTAMVLGAAAVVWFGSRIAIVAVRARRSGPPMGPRRID